MGVRIPGRVRGCPAEEMTNWEMWKSNSFHMFPPSRSSEGLSASITVGPGRAQHHSPVKTNLRTCGPAGRLQAFSVPAGFRHGLEREVDRSHVKGCEGWWRAPENKLKMKTNYHVFFFHFCFLHNPLMVGELRQLQLRRICSTKFV